MDEKIKKLLASNNLDDIRVGWELLKSKNIPEESEEWWPYFNIFYISNHHSTTDVVELHCTLLESVYDNWSHNKYWKAWAKQTINLKKDENIKMENL